jgi:alkylation response protein AidB-like acyl-CoA dehydrogenase
MDLELSASELAFQREFRAWLDRNLPAELSESRLRRLPRRQAWEERQAFERRMGAEGWLGVAWPVEYGGRGATIVEQVIYQQELVERNAPLIPGSVGVQLVGPMLIQVGTEAQKQRYLRAILRGEETWYQGFSEPNAGSDLAGLQTRAVLDGDHWVLTGQKVWGASAEYATWGAVLARTDPDAPKHRGISFMIVPMRAPGITVSYIKEMSGHADLNEVFFDGVRVPRDNVLGGVNQGWRVANGLLGYERGVMTLGFADRLIRRWHDLREHARQTRRNGRLLIETPPVREGLARTWLSLQLMRLANLRWVTHYARGAQPREETSYMKLYWSEAEQGLADLALELGGGAALALEDEPGALDDGRWGAEWMRSRAVTILGGTQDIQRNIIAERILGLPRGA